MTEQTQPDPLASTQKPRRPDDVYRCRHENILNLGTYGECASCYQRFDPADLDCHRWPTAVAFSPDEQEEDSGELTPLEVEQAWDYFNSFHRMPDWAEGKLWITSTAQDSGELVPGYETEAWDDPAHAWKTPITFHGMTFTVYTGSVSGRTAEEVRAHLQHEYRAAQIGTPEVAR